ncbi:MAG TPA: helix-turn-helix domain-containing protein [Pyrinomonadaceae bacterium]|jgi:DNA-binding NtrC family response regulator|nr:helix-turn-helix domain-containing protein [Pyrinomonadaceae bacterium]
MSSSFHWERNGSNAARPEAPLKSELARHSLDNLREAALTVLKEVESLANNQPESDRQLGLQEEVQRYEMELIRNALERTRGNQRRAAKLLGVKVTTLNCKIKRYGINVTSS